MSKNIFGIIFLILFITGIGKYAYYKDYFSRSVSLYSTYSTKKAAQCKTLRAPVLSQKINFMENKVPLETALIKLSGKLYLIVTYLTNSESPHGYNPMYIYLLSENGKIETAPMEFAKTQHIRHMTSIKTPWGEGLLFADHGVDGNGYPGGNLVLLVVDKKTNSLVDLSKNLNIGLNFSFNVAAIRRSHSKYQDILVAPVNNPSSRVIYLKATDVGYIDWSDKLPLDWQAFNVCFMTSIPFDIDHDDKDEIVVGGCDRNMNENPSEQDRLLTWQNSRWKFSAKETFPNRKQLPSWGTVFWFKDFLNKKEPTNETLIALTHDKGFQKGDLQIFHFDQMSKKFIEEPIKASFKDLEKYPHYFHKIKSFELDKDGQKELIGLVRYVSPDPEVQRNSPKPNLFVLKKDLTGKWIEQASCLDIPEKEMILGLDVIENKASSSSSLVITYFSGRYDIFNAASM
ncbi:MAG: hypothetical protein PHY93_06050 [Bacteriovorax sp.]|nr:hypothetical protein [Bacteriovorax sp.]